MNEKTQMILRQRAVELAKPFKEEAEKSLVIDCVEFRLQEEVYAIESIYVNEVYPLKDITSLPGTPDFVYGLINVRRKVYSIVNLKPIFDLGEHELNDANRVLILENEEREFALLTDEIIGIRSFLANELKKTLPTLSGSRLEFLKGITPERTVLLDAKRLLGSEELLVQQRI